jgi:hypothetical protein
MRSHYQTGHASIAPARLDGSVSVVCFAVATGVLWKHGQRFSWLSDTRTVAQTTLRVGALTISCRLIYLNLDLRAAGDTQSAAQATWPLALLTVAHTRAGSAISSYAMHIAGRLR